MMWWWSFPRKREDDLFNAFNEDGLHIGEVKVDINPITAQRTGTLETYLPQAEEYLESIRQESLADLWYNATCIFRA